MLRSGEVFTETAQRLIEFGCNESQAYALTRVMLDDGTTLKMTSSDSEVETAVICAFVTVKQAVEGEPDVEYIGGQNRGLIRGHA